MVLHGYEIAGKQLMETGEHRAPFAETFTFVFCGNFSSVPHTPDTPRSEIMLLFKRFAEVKQAKAAPSRAWGLGGLLLQAFVAVCCAGVVV